MATDKRIRNTRPSKYRPRTEAQKAQRRALVEARLETRAALARERQTAALQARFVELDTALRDGGRTGINGRRNSRPLDSITDDAERFAVLKARVERLEALWSLERRKREIRAKILLGSAILAELTEAGTNTASGLCDAVMDILDRRVAPLRDRMILGDVLGGDRLPLKSATFCEAPVSAVGDEGHDPFDGDRMDPDNDEALH